MNNDYDNNGDDADDDDDDGSNLILELGVGS